ncbi:Uu.00g117140.m01.CDS01 [Anthostomella pinea]|uniref:Uu.00g117140.m01.CDS01 n=1 Tax=Anthostomella pinea TaxID=933095 RepID=A0AAI8YGT6_9PEZI|nr:Uu.00g117140.m01.CDS01 [Anthostomella pinea]
MTDQNSVKEDEMAGVGGVGGVGDVEMGGMEPAVDGSLGDGADGRETNGGAHEAAAEQTTSTHTPFAFEVKPDPDAGEQQPPSSSPTDDAKMKSGPKKKGTAAKKGPRKTKTPKSKAAAAKKKNAAGGVDANEASSDDETDNGPYCICRGPDDHRWMISCDVCEDWFHGECVSLAKETGEKLVERFVCPGCTDGKRNYTKYKKTCSLPGCKNAARLFTKNLKDRSVFCSNDHCDAWWASMITTLPQKAASKKAVEVLTQEDFMGLLAATAEKGGWKLGDKPFGNIEGMWANGLPTRHGVLSDEEQKFLQTSAAERLALGNEIVQYKKMMQLMDWANHRRQAAIEAGNFTKDSCGYDWRLDTVSVRVQFAAWLETAEGQATFKAGKLDAPLDSADDPHPPAVCGTCDKKRCKPHNGWYKVLMSAVRVLIKETATAAANKLEAEEVMRQQAESRYERRQLENNWVEVLE